MTNAYDEIAYPSGAFRQTHPGRLAAHAMLFGLAPARVETARVLEIGAGDGSNLIPMALGCPDGHFVGFDLAGEPVRRGNETIAALGLDNIRLFQADILDVDFGGEMFDYIVAQGVYSWVPPPVRDALMRLVGERLASGGVAYVSFNALPGGYVRLAIRHELLFAVRDIVGRTARMEAAMRHLQAWPEPSPAQHPFRRAMAGEAAAMKKRSLGTLTHDELSDAYYPVYLQDFAREAAREGLRILAGADELDIGEWLPPPGVPENAAFDLIGRAQRADLDGVRFFREMLLVSAAAADRRLCPEAIAELHVSSRARRVEGNLFEGEGARFTLDDATLASVLGRLAAIWPATAPAGGLGLDEGRLLALARLHGLRALELQAVPSRFITAAGERPMASPPARLQARQGHTRLTTLRHTMNDVDDDFSRGFVASLDGTRTRAEIARDIAPRFDLTADGALAPLGVLLDVLARAPLLVR